MSGNPTENAKREPVKINLIFVSYTPGGSRREPFYAAFLDKNFSEWFCTIVNLQNYMNYIEINIFLGIFLKMIVMIILIWECQ